MAKIWPVVKEQCECVISDVPFDKLNRNFEFNKTMLDYLIQVVQIESELCLKVDDLLSKVNGLI